MSDIEPPVLRKHAVDGKKRRQRIVSLVTAAALSGALIAAAAGPASAAVRQPARTAPISLASSDNGVSTTSLTAAARYVHLSDGRFILDTLDAERAGVSNHALSAESALVTGLNEFHYRATATADSVRKGSVDAANAGQTGAAPDTSITVLPRITLIIDSTGIQLSMTPQAVTEVETVLGFGQDVAFLVGDILDIAGVGTGADIADIVGESIALFDDGFKLCTASDGSATFTIRWAGLPSCSGINLT